MCRDGIRKAKALKELNLARDAKNNKTGFYRCHKRKTRESVALLTNEDRELVTADVEKADVLNNYLPRSSLVVRFPTSLKSPNL